MKVTFLVNSYDKPTNLWVVLGSLIQQTDPDWEAIVLLNHPDENVRKAHREIDLAIADNRTKCVTSYHPDPAWDPYWASDWAIEQGLAHGEWLVFASDDSYYMPEFIEEMACSDKDVVICDLLMRKYTNGQRRVFNALPKANHCDKTNFMVRRSRWPGFQQKRTDPKAVPCSDAMTIQYLADNGYSIDKVDRPMVVHN